MKTSLYSLEHRLADWRVKSGRHYHVAATTNAAILGPLWVLKIVRESDSHTHDMAVVGVADEATG